MTWKDLRLVKTYQHNTAERQVKQKGDKKRGEKSATECGWSCNWHWLPEEAVIKNTWKAVTLLSSSDIYCSLRTRERCADCLFASILKSAEPYLSDYSTCINSLVNFSCIYDTLRKNRSTTWLTHNHIDDKKFWTERTAENGTKYSWYIRGIFSQTKLAHLLALFGSRVESSPANACCNSTLEKGCVKLSPSPVLCTSGSPFSFSGPPALASSFDTSLGLLLSEGVDSFSIFDGGVGPLSNVQVLTPELWPAVLTEATTLVANSGLEFLLPWCCCCLSTELLSSSNRDMSWSSSSLYFKQEIHQQMAPSPITSIYGYEKPESQKNNNNGVMVQWQMQAPASRCWENKSTECRYKTYPHGISWLPPVQTT